MQIFEKKPKMCSRGSNPCSVARIFSSEIADFCPIYRQIRQLFGPKSRKIRQFLAIYSGKINPLSPKFWLLLHFYALIFSEFKICKFF